MRNIVDLTEKTGISTASFYPEYTEKAFSYLCENNVKYIEYFANTSSEQRPPIITGVKRHAEEYDIKVTSVHAFTGAIEPFMIFTKYERRFQDMLEFLKSFFETAAYLGAPYLVFHGDKRQGYFTNEEYFERFERMYDLGRTFGVTILQENVERCRSGAVEFISDMKWQLKEKANFTLDIKQAVRADVNPFDMLDAMGDSLRHIHISDNDPDHACMLVGKGTFDFKAMAQKLKALNYSGAMVLEYYDFCYSEWQEVLDSLEVLREMIK